MIDFHSHLDLYPDPRDMAKKCDSQGMYVLSVTTTPSAWKGTAALAESYPRIKTSLGLHPQLAHQRISELTLFDEYLPETKYVGEIGLDGTPEFKKYWKDQITVFHHILDSCSKASGRILTIHSRRAATAVLDSLEMFPNSGTPVLHWFTGSQKELERAVSLGCWFSVGPAMFESKKARDLISDMPTNRVITETDGPFAQVNGRNAVPWDANLASAQLATIWTMDPVEADAHIHKNLKRLVT